MFLSKNDRKLGLNTLLVKAVMLSLISLPASADNSALESDVATLQQENGTDALWQTAHEAIGDYDDNALKALLVEHDELANSAVHDGYTLLQSAAFNGNVSAVQMLLDKGADPNKGTRPPISAAIPSTTLYSLTNSESDEDIKRLRMGQAEIIIMLHDHGANYNVQANKSSSFVEALIMGTCELKDYDPDVLEVFRENGLEMEVESQYLTHFHYIKRLAGASGPFAEMALDEECVDFFDQSIYRVN